MVENEGPDEDYDEMIYRNLPPPGSSENSSRTTTLTERSDNGLLEEDINRASSNVSSSNYKTKKPNQAKVPKLYIGEEERQRLLEQQEDELFFRTADAGWSSMTSAQRIVDAAVRAVHGRS